MGLKVGSTCFLKLDSFDPSWRQAVLLADPGSNKKLVFAVRITAAESKLEEATKYSRFSCLEELFLMVEGKQSQVRSNCNKEVRGLELPTYQIFLAGKETLDNSPDLIYATASEEAAAAEPSAGRTAKMRPRLEESSAEIGRAHV